MPKGERKEYSKEYKLAAVHMMKSKLFKPKEVFKLLGGVLHYALLGRNAYGEYRRHVDTNVLARKRAFKIDRNRNGGKV